MITLHVTQDLAAASQWLICRLYHPEKRCVPLFALMAVSSKRTRQTLDPKRESDDGKFQALLRSCARSPLLRASLKFPHIRGRIDGLAVTPITPQRRGQDVEFILFSSFVFLCLVICGWSERRRLVAVNAYNTAIGLRFGNHFKPRAGIG